jgi:hypothetical protein
MCDLITEIYACGCVKGTKQIICNHNATIIVDACPAGVTRTERKYKWTCGKYMLGSLKNSFKTFPK